MYAIFVRLLLPCGCWLHKLWRVPRTTKRNKISLSELQDGCAPTNEKELFNIKHTSTKNIIEHCFGLLKIRWAILRSPLFYPIKTQYRIITTCYLLHNLLRREMSYDLIEALLDRQDSL